MYKVTYQLFLEGPNEERIRLKIPRKSGFWINDCFYRGYGWIKDETYLYVDCYIYDGDLSDHKLVKRRAINETEKSNKILQFLFGFKIINEYPTFREMTETDSIEPTPTSNAENINKIHKFLGKLNNLSNFNDTKKRNSGLDLQKKYYAAISYFVRNLDAVQSELYEDAYLNIYRGLEMLGREYYKSNDIEQKIVVNLKSKISSFLLETLNENYEEKHNQIFNEVKSVAMKGFITDNRKMLLAARSFKFSKKELSNYNAFCRIRNSLSHGNTEDTLVEIEEIAIEQYYLRTFISEMLLGKSYSETYPMPDIGY